MNAEKKEEKEEEERRPCACVNLEKERCVASILALLEHGLIRSRE